MKLSEKVKSYAIIGATSLMLLPSQVFANNDGGFDDTVNTLSPVINKLQRPLSMGVNIGFLVFGLILGISAIWDFIKSGNEENPNNEKELRKRAIKKGIYAAISVIGITILNIVFAVLGIPWAFTA